MTPSELFAMLADETRLRSLILLHGAGEICVCEFSQVLDSIQPKISRHLSLLRKAGIVLDERRGQWVYYHLNKSMEPWAKSLLDAILTNLKDQKQYLADAKKLKALRHNDNCCG